MGVAPLALGEAIQAHATAWVLYAGRAVSRKGGKGEDHGWILRLGRATFDGTEVRSATGIFHAGKTGGVIAGS